MTQDVSDKKAVDVALAPRMFAFDGLFTGNLICDRDGKKEGEEEEKIKKTVAKEKRKGVRGEGRKEGRDFNEKK